MATLGLNHYNLRADHALMEKLRDFYCDIVGLAVGFRPPFGSRGYWLYAGEQAVLHLSEAAAAKFDNAAITTFDHAAFSCTGLAGFESRLTNRGVDFRVARVPQTDQVQIFLRDPAGNGVELNFASG
jgi:catechol-2,3-dioxygenase